MAGPRNATTTSRGRTYRWRDETFDSVTTILSGGIPKPALTSWAAKSVAEYVAENIDQVAKIAHSDPAAAIDLMKGSPWRKRDAAAAQGSDIHAWAEAHVLGQALQVDDQPENLRPYLRSFLRFLDDWRPVYDMVEATVYSRRYAYAGTLDAIATIGGRRTLVDYKTGKGVYGEVALQLAAYRFADFIGAPDGSEVPMPPVDGAAVLHITADGYSLIPVAADDRAMRYFRYVQQVRTFVETISREVLGAPMSLASEEVA